MYILGINESHTATAALLKDGQIVACASEERFSRVKSQSGLPLKSISYCLSQEGITMKEIDLVVFGALNPATVLWFRDERKHFLSTLFKKIRSFIRAIISGIYNIFPPILYMYQLFYGVVHFFYGLIRPILRYIHVNEVSKILKVDKDKIISIRHHYGHAYAANYIFGKSNKKRLVITNDGAGDYVCGMVMIFEGNKVQTIASTKNRYSLGYLYYYVTQLLGLIPDRDEYKVKGLAGYAPKDRIEETYPKLKNLIWVEGLKFKSKYDRVSFYIYLSQELSNKRFDAIAGAIQQLTEKLVEKQVFNVVDATKITDVHLGGGLHMNIKANMRVVSLKKVKSLHVCPSGGDESVAIGAAYYGYIKLCKEKGIEPKITALKNLFLGPSFEDKEILAKIKQQSIEKSKYMVSKLANKSKAKQIAKLLAKGCVIARFSGRMEFGARALGNRSILADPRHQDVIRVLNDQIKQRDFWMPFSPTILEESSHKYIINPKRINSPYMMIGFDTTEFAQKNLKAAIHPYDFTCRPQILSRETNPEYYELIKEFEKLTGISAVLNTSFNLHGEPIVCSPDDALSTFKRSGLQYLLLENYLITKK